MEVDPGTGCVTLRIPMGPGVGSPGFQYVPSLIGRFAPQVGLAGSPGSPVLLAPAGFELSPGHLDWRTGPGESGEEALVARWVFPDGSGGRTGGRSAPADPREVLARFGYGREGTAVGPDVPGCKVVAGVAGDLLLALPGSGPRTAPSAFLVIRGERAFEYRPGPSGTGRFRLVEVRDPSGGRLTFTYGPNQVDFQAAGDATRVRVALEGRAPTAPVPALGRPGQDLEAPSQASLDTEARLQVTYEGQEPLASYTVLAMAGPDEGPGKTPEAFRDAMQVTRVQDETTGESIRIGYGRGPGVEHPGPLGTRSFAPTVLTDIASDERALRIEWEAVPWERPGPGGGPAWRFGATAVRKQDGGGIEEPSRQFRHFALGPGVPCRTHVRNRWNLGNPAGDGDGPIPTFELDSRTLSLVPVPGQLTRWVRMRPGDPGDPPDLHTLGRPGLRGGAFRQPYSKWPGGITYDPSKREATMEAISGPTPPLGASGRVMQPGEALFHGPGLLAQQIAKNQKDIQETSQRTAALLGPAIPPPIPSATMAQAQWDQQKARLDEMFRNQQRAQQAAIERAKEEHARQVLETIAPPTGPTHPSNIGTIEFLRPIATSMAGKEGSVLILIWDWAGLGVVGPGHSVGHAALAIKGVKNEWKIIQSQFPHEPGGVSKPHGPNVLISRPSELIREEGGRKPESAFLVSVPNLGGLIGEVMADLGKGNWFVNPNLMGNSTNCTYGIIQSLRAGGVPLSSMWANQTLIIPGSPYTPRDLRTALARDADFNVIHPYKIHHQNNLVDEIDWER